MPVNASVVMSWSVRSGSVTDRMRGSVAANRQ
jgi:hypothetical protein